jgi:hypothetical protein
VARNVSPEAGIASRQTYAAWRRSETGKLTKVFASFFKKKCFFLFFFEKKN